MFLFLRITGLLLIAAGIYSLFVLLTLPPSAEEVLDRLPDYDFTVEARRLMAQKRFGEAKILCQDIIENDLPGRESAEIIVRMCGEKLKSVKVRLLRAAEAFVTGNPGESVEEAGSAVISDMLMYGDIRDLVMQGYYKVTGKETDPYVAAFAAAGLATELIDAADWLPSLFKALRRSGSISDKMARGILDVLRFNAGRGKRTLQFCTDVKDIYRKGGFLRTKTVFKNLGKADDVADAARVMRKTPSAAHLVSRAAGNHSADVFRKLAADNASPSFLRKLLCKGPNGVTAFLRVSKSVKKGNVTTAFYGMFRVLKNIAGIRVWLIPAVLIGAGLLLDLKYLLKTVRFLWNCRAGKRKNLCNESENVC